MNDQPIRRLLLPALILIASSVFAQPKKGDDGELITEAKNAKVQPIVIVRPQDVDEKSMSGQYRFYLGTTHAHSGFSGDHQKGIAEKLKKGVANYSLHTPAEIFE